jgi:hypothetical protein
VFVDQTAISRTKSEALFAIDMIYFSVVALALTHLFNDLIQSSFRQFIRLLKKPAARFGKLTQIPADVRESVAISGERPAVDVASAKELLGLPQYASRQGRCRRVGACFDYWKPGA